MIHRMIQKNIFGKSIYLRTHNAVEEYCSITLSTCDDMCVCVCVERGRERKSFLH